MQDVDRYDYVVVGAGSAGCVLAARLSEDPEIRVLLLEAGGWDRDPLIHIPIGIGKIGLGRRGDRPVHDWGYETEPEHAIGGRRLETRRGKILGGCSSINVMAYVRGNRGDFDRWASKGLPGWSYEDVLPYFKRCETFAGGEDSYRGRSGPLGVTFAQTPDPLFPAIIEAGRTAGFPATGDYNGARQEGFGRSQFTIRDGRRSSAATAFLKPAARRRNLTIKVNAVASRVLLEGTSARGVAYLSNGRTRHAYADREVILSGGVFNSPHLLMLSGIGDPEELASAGVEPKVCLRGVGANLQDHPAVTLRWSRPAPGVFHKEMRADRMLWNLIRAYVFGSGPATYLPGGVFAFVKTDPGVDLPDIQYLFPASPADARLWFPGIAPAYEDGFGIRPCLLRPLSRGRLSLASADPSDKIRIYQNFFAEPEDLATLRTGCRHAREVAAQASLDPFRGRELTPGLEVASDSDFDAWVRKTVGTASHASCTCAMGNGPDAVLDEFMRVRGVDGLRVVDASAMPDVTSGNINACVLMMAEKASDMILGKSSLPRRDAGLIEPETSDLIFG